VFVKTLVTTLALKFADRHSHCAHAIVCAQPIVDIEVLRAQRLDVTSSDSAEWTSLPHRAVAGIAEERQVPIDRSGLKPEETFRSRAIEPRLHMPIRDGIRPSRGRTGAAAWIS
jgi:hypothetical protein